MRTLWEAINDNDETVIHNSKLITDVDTQRYKLMELLTEFFGVKEFIPHKNYHGTLIIKRTNHLKINEFAKQLEKQPFVTMTKVDRGDKLASYGSTLYVNSNLGILWYFTFNKVLNAITSVSDSEGVHINLFNYMKQ